MRAALLFLLPFGIACLLSNASAATAKVDFQRDIEPIFTKHCHECHSAKKQKSGLRLDDRAAALRGGDNGPVLAPGKPASESKLFRFITSTVTDEMMPPKGDRLSAAQVQLIKQWIESGAEWGPGNLAAASAKPHWAYVKPVRPAVPEFQSSKLKAQTPIDAFIFSRLAKEGLQPSPPAERAVLLRRVSLDLTGLPPTPAEVDAFLADTRADAYERVVDRLFASPHYGEKWARPWLDLARYADSNGFQRDGFRDLWAFRDWVVRAMNADMPFDRFTTWQIAGDLLPEAQSSKLKAQNADALIATGFHRCTTVNVEAGTDQEENRVNQVIDRVNTTGTVWLGTTIECAQCHNHKYDPVTMRDYYRLFAFFNNTEIETKFKTVKATAAIDFIGPMMDLSDTSYEQQRAKLQAQLDQLSGQIVARGAKVNPPPATTPVSAKGKKTVAKSDKAASNQTAPLTPALSTSEGATNGIAAGAWLVLDIAEFHSAGGATGKVLADKSVLVGGPAPNKDTYTVTVASKLTNITAFKLEALTDASLPGNGPGRGDKDRPNFILNSFRVTEAPESDPNSGRELHFTSARADFSQVNWDVSGAIDKDPKSGWAINPQFHQPHWAVFNIEQPAGTDAGAVFTFTLEQSYGVSRTIGRLRLSALVGGAEPAVASDPELRRLQEEHDKVVAALKKMEPPQTLVMKEMPEARMTAVFKRGNFLDRGDDVQAATPEFLHSLKVAADVRRLTPNAERGTRNAEQSQSLVTSAATPKLTRLDLARWLVDRENPLVARVTVNRWWAEFFGRGLVATPEDFGTKGDLPAHPELLDWLAVELMEPLVRVQSPESNVLGRAAGSRLKTQDSRPWSMKHMHKLIVMSSTYQQSARVTPELLARDDQNLLLARGARFRLDAEGVRDNALFAAGLLSLKLGGPPVKPFQPAGLWTVTGVVDNSYKVSEGEDAYRRGLYTVWRRSALYPSFVNFDATPRGLCTVKRSRSNTPLQALTLLNDPVYVEAAQALARRVLAEKAGASVEERVRHAFRICLARAPRDAEMKALAKLVAEQLAAKQSEQAAWEAVAAVLLNLDEMITKG